MIYVLLVGIVTLLGTLWMPGGWFDKLPGFGVALLFLWLAWDMREVPSLPAKFKVKSTRMDERGRPVIIVQANNYHEAAKPIEGTTYRGGHWEINKTGENEYTIHAEDN